MKTKISTTHDRLTLSAKNDLGGSLRVTLSRSRDSISGKGPGIDQALLRKVLKMVDFQKDETSLDRLKRTAAELEKI